MNPSDIKSLAAFQKAARLWQKEHRNTSRISLNNDFKLLKTTNKTALILASGNKPGAFLVSRVIPKYLRTVLYFVEDGKVLKTTENYKQRKKGLEPLIDGITSVDWDKGTFHGSQCLYVNDPYIFVSVFSKTSNPSEEVIDNTLKDAYIRANDEYNNSEDGVSFLSDQEFDALEALLKQRKALPQAKKEVGAPVKRGVKVALPNVMPSLEYEKSVSALQAWAKKTGVIELEETPKIDGISLQLIYNNKGELVQAFLRGNGTESEDKTATAKQIPDIPKKLKKPVALECRVEAYMQDDTFAQKYSSTSGSKYNFASSRATVAGMFNRTTPDTTIVKDIKIFGFESFKGIQAKTKAQMLKAMNDLGIPVVPSRTVKVADLDKANESLKTLRASRSVGMDGVVYEVSNLSDRDKLGTETNSINPAWAKAYKPASEDAKQTKVTSIKWKLSNTGYIKPTVMLEPVNIKGVTVSKTAGFNAAFIRDNKLGPGAVVEMIRQGDAIPYLQKIIKGTTADFKGAEAFGKYTWNETKVDLILDKGESSDELTIQQLIRFFESVGAEYFSEGTIRKLYKAGYNTVPGILKITDKQLSELGGFQTKAIERTRTIFKKLMDPGITLPTFMYSSGAFGRGLGKDKLIKIYEVFGDNCLKWEDGTKIRDIASSIETIHGFSFDTGVQFAKGIKPFMKFAKECGDLISIITPKQASGNKLKGTIALLTGFRDQAIQDFIIDQGGRIASSMNKSVTLLLIKDKSTNNDKTAKAKTMGTPVLTQEEFKNKYM